ncbi:MAG: biotin--[acetyl-CoA-carboxylase] ligase [Thermoanaerobaculales bacterium]|nr:biotin--[acetyl-CoA-carboxylase] ligase [Thermoanaerobaculales bacterium]
MAPLTDFGPASERLAAAARPAVENVVVLESVDSTQACGLRLAEQADAEEVELPTTLIIAGRQDRGRGRHERRWASPEGGLYLSWVSSRLEPGAVATLPMLAAAAAAEGVVRLGLDGVRIKWPNDLLLGGRKLGGCLVHARHGETTRVIVGVGVNLGCTPQVDGAKATSVADHLGYGEPVDWAETIVRAFVVGMAAGIADPEPLLAVWRERLVHRPGDRLAVRQADGDEVAGRFAGLTDDGHLRLTLADGERVFSAGDVLE